jgi:hypothetical protein
MPGAAARDISQLVWLGCLALLFLAVAVHEGWFSGSANPIITSGTVNDGSTSIGDPWVGPGVTGDW